MSSTWPCYATVASSFIVLYGIPAVVIHPVSHVDTTCQNLLDRHRFNSRLHLVFVIYRDFGSPNIDHFSNGLIDRKSLACCYRHFCYYFAVFNSSLFFYHFAVICFEGSKVSSERTWIYELKKRYCRSQVHNWEQTPPLELLIYGIDSHVKCFQHPRWTPLNID